MSIAWWLNTLWMQRSDHAARQFACATRQVATAQSNLLLQTLAGSADTEFGREHGFHRCRNVADYQARVPVRTYDDFVPWIERIAHGEDRVLTAERVQLFEPTSGSTSAEKLIPYTPALKRQFQAAIGAWIHDLFWHRPAVRQGRAYWSLSPAFGARRCTPGGVPIGFDSDDAYLGGLERLLARRLLVMPAAVAKLRASDAFRYVTLLHLLAAEDLSLISIWSPTFLTSLFASLPAWSERLCDDLRQGTLRGCPIEIDERLKRLLAPRCSQRRAAQLASIFRQGLRPAWSAEVWPRLALISCWADASAALYFSSLQELFPAVEIQPKGLISTEAFISFPAYSLSGAPLAVTSHFVEFIDDSGGARLAHQLEVGAIYRVVVTTGGGLYRYDLNDLVEVTGYAVQCPLLRFRGRNSGGSDLVGEKLSEPFVREVLQRLFERVKVAPRFSLLVPMTQSPPRYRLYLQTSSTIDTKQIAADLDCALCENPHYQLAIQLQQLAGVEIAQLDPAAPCPWQAYEVRRLIAGQRAGAIKPHALDAGRDWASLLDPLVRCVCER